MSNFSQYFPASSGGGSGGIPINGYTPFLVEFTGQPSGYNSTTGLYTHPDGTYWMESGKTIAASTSNYPDATSVSTYSYPTSGVAFENFDVSGAGINFGGITTDGTNFYVVSQTRTVKVYNSAGVFQSNLFSWGTNPINGSAADLVYDGTFLWTLDQGGIAIQYTLAGVATGLSITNAAIGTGRSITADGTNIYVMDNSARVNTYNSTTGVQQGTTITLNANGTDWRGIVYEATGFLLVLADGNDTYYRYTIAGLDTGDSFAVPAGVGSRPRGGFSVSAGIWLIGDNNTDAYLISKTSVIGDATARTDTDTAQPLFTRIK